MRHEWLRQLEEAAAAVIVAAADSFDAQANAPPSPTDEAGLLEQMRALYLVEHAARAGLATRASELRSMGVSWRVIAEACGTSLSNAHQRWRDK